MSHLQHIRNVLPTKHAGSSLFPSNFVSFIDPWNIFLYGHHPFFWSTFNEAQKDWDTEYNFSVLGVTTFNKITEKIYFIQIFFPYVIHNQNNEA